MRILLTNDDGYRSHFYQHLALELQKDHDVTLVAPEQNNSGVSHAITLLSPVFFGPVEDFENPLKLKNFYKICGYPADCTKFAMMELMKDNKPDLVISGVNMGANMGCDVLYSGTVSAAVEGVLNGVSSMAISYFRKQITETRLQEVVKWARQFVKQMEPWFKSDLRLINVNYPELPPEEIKGIKVSSVGRWGYADHYEKRVSPWLKDYYWLTGEVKFAGEVAGCDKDALKNGYISVSPLKVEFTDHAQIEGLQAVVDKL